METLSHNHTPRVDRCRVCLSGTLGELPFGYRWDGRWFAAVECRTCGIIFLDPQPETTDLARLYSREYFEKDFRCGHTGSYFDEATRLDLQNDPVLERIIGMKPPAARFLEVGCAGGAFLAAARSKGYEVTGIEFSDQAAHIARENYDLDVIVGDILSAHLPADTFDIVFLGDVLEHLLDPVISLGEIHRLMRPGGLIVVVCPSQTNTIFSRAGFIVYRLLGRKTNVQLPPYHVFEYRPKSITHMFEQCGYRILRLENNIIPPSEIALRGPAVQRVLKKMFHYPNTAATKMTGRWGDRLELYATKP
jgi:SAM-dependent methyltransferase